MAGITPERTAESDYPSWIFRPGFNDRFAAAVEAANIVASTMDRVTGGAEAHRPKETRLGQFFGISYRVGGESLTRDIPTHALLEVLATALLVLRNCLLGVFGREADRVKRNPLYRMVLNPLLVGFYWLVMTSRDRPRRPRTIFLALVTLAAIGLLLGLLAEVWLLVVAAGGSLLLLIPALWFWIRRAVAQDGTSGMDGRR